MAIFVALIFQVLFVFFAMVINISMIVHDKIVLQNSVDLAAYYAAQKQAEVLNQMGHINYQIRQVNKLLAWRQWVLGDLGYDHHPLRGGPTLPLPPLLDQLDAGIVMDSTLGTWSPPGICITHSDWLGTVSSSPGATITTNMCGKRSLALPEIPPFTSVNPLVPILGDLKRLTENLAIAAANNCQSLGPINWSFAAKIQASYRMDLSMRKKMMMELANQLSEDPSDFRDIRGDSVFGGVEKVVQKNVNQNQVPPEVEMLNSLALGSCGGSGFVRDIVINPMVTYADFYDPPGPMGCTVQTKFVACGDDSCKPEYAGPSNGFPGVGENVYRYFQTRPMDFPEEQRPSLGYEKNPWCMAYVGVKAKMTSRKPFGPFGNPVELTATGYAKPFGGSLGPWYNTQWGPGQDHSHGTEKVDYLAPTRDLPGVSMSFGGVANYSRYPGDRLGYASKMERGALRSVFLGPGNFGYGGMLLDRKFYAHIDQLSYLELTGNSLADTLTDPSSTSSFFRLRQLEMAAVAPDLFDITYYPVEPDYYHNYLKEQIDNNLFDRAHPISDLGSHLQHPDFKEANVGLQVTMTSRNPTGTTKPYRDEVFYKIRDQAHLLTWWLPTGLVDYGPPGTDFMRCEPSRIIAGGEVPQPGMCYDGGRVGHSVKLVHGDYLTSEQHQLGGQNAARGGLLNPPEAAGW